jgi:hypothetical protein
MFVTFDSILQFRLYSSFNMVTQLVYKILFLTHDTLDLPVIHDLYLCVELCLV